MGTGQSIFISLFKIHTYLYKYEVSSIHADDFNFICLGFEVSILKISATSIFVVCVKWPFTLGTFIAFDN